METFDLRIDQYRGLTAKNRGDLKISYLFGIVLSVAASVTASLLMLSGDIEENPVPGKEHRILLCSQYAIHCIIGADLDYNSVDATQELSKLPNDAVNGPSQAYQLLNVQAKMIW